MCVFRNDLSICLFIASFILNDFQTLRFRQEMLSFLVDPVNPGETRVLDMGLLWVEEDVAAEVQT